MKKILIALDYSPTAQKVAEVGYSLAKDLRVEVVLIHVISEPMYYSSTVYSPIMGFGGYGNVNFFGSDVMDQLRKTTQHFLDKTKAHLGDDTIKTHIKEGDVADLVIQAAKDLQADIIVIGSHSQKWLEKIVMGSVTEKTLHHTRIPLFIIPTKKIS